MNATDFDNKNNLDRFVVRPSCSLTGHRIGARLYRATYRAPVTSHSPRASQGTSLIAIRDEAGYGFDIEHRGKTRVPDAEVEHAPFASSPTDFIDKNLMAVATAITRDRRREA